MSKSRRSALFYVIAGFLIVVTAVTNVWANGFIARPENSRASSSVSEPVIRLEQFRSCRSCPAYEVVISRDGAVTYVGKDFVNIKGVALGRLEVRALESLIAAAEALQFENLSMSYMEPGWPDASIAEVAYWRDGFQRVVRFQFGVGKASVALQEFAKLIDSTVGTRKWICPVPQFNEIVCPKQ